MTLTQTQKHQQQQQFPLRASQSPAPAWKRRVKAFRSSLELGWLRTAQLTKPAEEEHRPGGPVHLAWPR